MSEIPPLDPIAARFDEFEGHFVEDLRRCMRRQLWTVIRVLTIAIIVFSAIFGGLLAAFGRVTGGALSTMVFSLIAVVVALMGMLREG
jgi:hypothetical protein